MPLIKNNKTIEEIEASIEEAEKGYPSAPPSPKGQKPLAKKKEPKWGLIYFLLAIVVFGLGLLTIALMNLWIYGTFGI